MTYKPHYVARVEDSVHPMASNPVLFVGNDLDVLQNDRYTKPARSVKTDEELLKGVRKYTRTARKAWEAMSIPEDQGIDFEGRYIHCRPY